MKNYIVTIGFLLSVQFISAQSLLIEETPFEINNNYSASYQEAINVYQEMANKYPNIVSLQAIGATDIGYPLHLAILDTDGDFDPLIAKKKKKTIIFILNAIHPGEPCGIDATILLYKQYLQSNEIANDLKNSIILSIPIYNIGGALNRNSYSRVNQNGPELYGFRGNAKNLDLNRDFIKTDSKNTYTIQKIFKQWDPDLFIDNHTTNGADYQHTMTLLSTQKDKLEPSLSRLLTKDIEPYLYKSMQKKGWPMCPYVFANGDPINGINGFLDYPRFSIGYAALRHTIGFTAEAHMLKPYKDRVESTLDLMKTIIQYSNLYHHEIILARTLAKMSAIQKTSFDLDWKQDNSQSTSINFHGYYSTNIPSKFTGKNRLYYDTAKPYKKNIKYFNTFTPHMTVTKPLAYVIPQAYSDIVNLLHNNGVQIDTIKTSTLIQIEKYQIDNFSTVKNPYEGHYLHYNINTKINTENQKVIKGDFLIQLNQELNNLIVNTLEPQAPDSYFAWNFFDGILMQKEHFSDYVFEDLAYDLLQTDPELKAKFEKKKSEDPNFHDSAHEQLRFIYQNSIYYEPTLNKFPISRIIKLSELKKIAP